MAWGEHHRLQIEQTRLLKRLVELGEVEVALLKRIVAELVPFAVTAEMSLGGTMPLTVGGTTTATLGFVDASGDPAAPPTGDGSGLTVTFASNDTDVATVGTATAGTDSAAATATTPPS